MSVQKHSLETAGFIAVEGGKIHYRYYEPHNKDCAKKTPIIFIHGGPGGCHASMYDALHELANDQPLLFYDQLGSHFSPATITPDLMRVDRFIDELKRLMEGLSIDKATLLGHSWGGVIATEFALNNPEKIDTLILSSPLLSTRRWIDDCNKLLNDLPQETQDTIRRCEEEGTTDSADYAAADKVFSSRHYCRQDPKPEAMIKHRNKSNRSLYNAMWGPSEFSCHGTLKHLDLWPRLHKITAKTLLICGAYDTATPATMKEAQSEIKGSSVSIIPNSGHAVYFDNNKAYLQAVQSFLSEKQREPNLAPTLNPTLTSRYRNP